MVRMVRMVRSLADRAFQLWLWPAPTERLLPALGYLELCAAAHLRARMLDHFLDSTVLNDRLTTLREYCTQNEYARRVISAVLAEESEVT